MPGCNECKFHCKEPGYYEGGVYFPNRTCLSGHTQDMFWWWENNGPKAAGNLDDMPCHEHHDSTKCLMKMNELLDKMNELL